ncbi:MAG: DNA repair protein RadC [Clostridiaceae bacterium]|nr:DNA repair protein RadC [Clostridiaceae bacterium]
MTKNLHTGHREKLRQRFINEGLNSFEDHQVLELLLFYTIPRRDTNELAHRLIDKFGTLANLLDASPEIIEKEGKVNRNTAVFLAMIPQLARRYILQKQGKKPVLDSSCKAGKYVTSLFIGKNYEAFYVCCLNSQNRLNYAALVHEGTINEAPVYPRLIVETALRYQASSVILAHNHPGGSLRPSTADIEVTRRICDALSTISITVIDHLIAAGDEYFSFAENGLLQR